MKKISVCKTFFFLAASQGLQHLSSLTRDQTQALAVKAQCPSDRTVRKFPVKLFKK